MKIRDRRTEALRRPAHLVQTDEAVVPVERGVLDGLRHHGAGELLEAQREPNLRGALLGLGLRAQEENVLQKGEDGRAHRHAPTPRRSDRALDPQDVLLRGGDSFTQVRAVHREGGDRLGQRVREAVASVKSRHLR